MRLHAQILSLNMDSSKFFALIPAAGQSHRMGQPKLLMPWQGRRVIDSVLNAWTNSLATRVLVVLRNEDAELIQACRKWAVDIVPLKQPTADMKGSILAGLEQIANQCSPLYTDQILIAPADLPRISTELIDQVARSKSSDKIVVPYFCEKRGHPIRIPWKLTQLIRTLGQSEGLNTLIESNPISRVKISPDLRPRDIDTPEDYHREIQHEKLG